MSWRGLAAQVVQPYSEARPELTTIFLYAAWLAATNEGAEAVRLAEAGLAVPGLSKQLEMNIKTC